MKHVDGLHRASRRVNPASQSVTPQFPASDDYRLMATEFHKELGPLSVYWLCWEHKGSVFMMCWRKAHGPVSHNIVTLVKNVVEANAGQWSQCSFKEAIIDSGGGQAANKVHCAVFQEIQRSGFALFGTMRGERLAEDRSMNELHTGFS